MLLVDETTPSIGRYPYAIVTDTKECADGMVRSVTVRTTDGPHTRTRCTKNSFP